MLSNIFKIPELRKRVLFSLFVIALFRAFAHVPVPGVDLEAIRGFLQGNELLGLFDLFSGGGFQNFSIVTLGLGPYINASIIFQLLQVTVPKLEELSKEGQYGRDKISQYTRYASLPLSLLQGFGVYFLLSSQGVITRLDPLSLTVMLFSLTAGAMLLMWVGELVTEYGIGNGISLLIFAGIISRLPVSAYQFVATITSDNLFDVLLIAAMSLIVIVGVVLLNEGTRNVPLEYGRRSFRGRSGTNTNTSYLPIKVNQVGVMPIIFAVAVVLVPSFIGSPLSAASNPTLQNIGTFLLRNFSATSLWYNVLYFFLVFGFTYFYTNLQFNPEKIADDIKRRGGFIPGVRPGKTTENYIKGIVTKLTIIGGICLGFVAILPYIFQTIFGVSAFAIGGAGLLIVVSVVLETMRQIESMMVTRNYDSFLG